MQRSTLVIFRNVEYLSCHGGAIGIIKDHKERFKESKEAIRPSKVNLGKNTAVKAQKVSN